MVDSCVLLFSLHSLRQVVPAGWCEIFGGTEENIYEVTVVKCTLDSFSVFFLSEHYYWPVHFVFCLCKVVLGVIPVDFSHSQFWTRR